MRGLSAFESFITEALERLGVPGAAVAVVAGDEVSLLRGFGVRALGESEPVTPDTLMMIDSLTKPLTTMLAATLVDDNRLTWETPVRALLPSFTLPGARPAPLTIADLFCGCAGVPRNDAELLFNAAEITPERLIAMAAALPVNAAVGERFQYTNHLFAIGGYAAAVAAEDAGNDLRHAYRQAMRARVLDPLGMANSTFALDEATRREDYAIPAAPNLLGEVQPLALEGEDAFARAVEPAGGLWSSAREMSRLLQAQIAGGVTPEGNQIVSRRSLVETWRPHVPIPPDPNLPPVLTAATRGYGLGWFIGEYAGQRLLSHSGGVSGFVSQIAFLPQERLGIVVLTNGGAGAHAFTLAATIRLFELLLNQPPIVEGLLAQQIAMESAQAAKRRARLGEIDEQAVAPYEGHYRNRRLGEITLELRDGALVLDAGEVRSPLLPRLGETGQVVDYLFVAPPLASLPVAITFGTGRNGERDVTLTVTGEDEARYVFSPSGSSPEGLATPPRGDPGA